MQQSSPDVLMLCPLFGGLSSDCCAAFAERLVREDLVPGQLVYAEGDPARALYVVAEGRIEVLKPSLVPDLALTDLHPGDFFGDMSFIDMQPRSATVRAALPSAVWRLDYAVLRETSQLDLKCYTLVVMNIAREMSRRLRRADRGWKPSQGQR